MGAKAILFTFFLLAIGIIVNRDRLSSKTQVYNAKQNTLKDYNQTLKAGLTIGKYEHRSEFSPNLLEKLTYKRINSFVVVHYNLYKIEVTIIDLGYTSQLLISVLNENTYFKHEEEIGVDLNEHFFKQNKFDISKRDFFFKMQQNQIIDDDGKEFTLTSFNISIKRPDKRFQAVFSHYIRNQQCFTIVRSGVISHKCYGGFAQGKAVVQHKDEEGHNKFSAYHIRQNVTRVLFDGLRGAGTLWQWDWIYGTGINKAKYHANNLTIYLQQWIGLNFGSLHGQSQNFVFLDGQIYSVVGLKYKFTQKFQKNSNITFTADYPKFEFNFTVNHRLHPYKDMGVALLDMVKAQGYWSGWIEVNGKVHDFSQIFAGLIQTSNSIF